MTVIQSKQELANKMVGLGMGFTNNNGVSVIYRSEAIPADEFVSDWRFVGKLMETVRGRGWIFDTMHDGYVYVFTDLSDGGEDDDGIFCSDSTEWPLAFTEVCVEALRHGESKRA